MNRLFFFFSSRRRHTIFDCDWSSDVCSSDLPVANTPQAILDLGLEGLEGYIKTIGLYRSKAKHLMQTCQILVERHGGQVPRTREELEALDRKSTRLNSSHSQISYAVFCLKKKTRYV